jgi:glycerol-3-phosphate dehydrogenase
MVRTGLALYDAFAGGRRLAPHSAAGARATLALEPELEPQRLRGCGLYTDAVMDDARLAITVARDAVAHGAAISTYTEVVGARPSGESAIELIARDHIEAHERRFEIRVVLNAAGAWADSVRVLLARSLNPGAPDPVPIMRPTRGVHLVYPRLTNGHGLVVFARADGRVFFVIPLGSRALVGTTEVEVSSPPSSDASSASVEEVRYLRAELKRVLPRPSQQPVLAVMSGLRPLVAAETGGTGEVGAFSREHRIVDDGPVLTIVGGKYTTFRVMARDALRQALPKLGRPELRLTDPVESLPRPKRFGALNSVDDLAGYAVDVELARRLEDVIRRRTPLWLMPDRGRVAAPLVAAAMGRKLGWSAERVKAELDVFHSNLEREERLLRAGREER